MDVDCDGADDKAGDCSNDPTGFGETAFKDTVQSYGISDLNANIHPYVVVNEPPFFDAQHFGLKPLSVMAIVCNNQVVSLTSPFSFFFFHLLEFRQCVFKIQKDFTDTMFLSGMVSGVIPTQNQLLERRPFLLLNCATLMIILLAIMDMALRMCYILDSSILPLFQARMVPSGMPIMFQILKQVSRHWVTGWLQALVPTTVVAAPPLLPLLALGKATAQVQAVAQMMIVLMISPVTAASAVAAQAVVVLLLLPLLALGKVTALVPLVVLMTTALMTLSAGVVSAPWTSRSLGSVLFFSRSFVQTEICVMKYLCTQC